MMNKISSDSKTIYNYQELLSSGICLHCDKPLQWELAFTKGDDRFCHAICCATRYSMVPEKVRVLTAFAYPLEEDLTDKELGVTDEDFLKELAKMDDSLQ